MGRWIWGGDLLGWIWAGDGPPDNSTRPTDPPAKAAAPSYQSGPLSPGETFDVRTGTYGFDQAAYDRAIAEQQRQDAAAADLRSRPTFNVSSSNNVSQNYQDPAVTQLQLQELEARRQQFAQQLAMDQAKFRYAQGRDSILDSQNMRAEQRANAQLMEQIQARMESTALAQTRTVAEAQQLQAQLDFQAAQANAQAQMQAAQINEQRKTANLEQRRGVAQDIASFARNPGDIGANAAYLTSGGPAPISQAIATGQDARTPQALVPLDLLLTNRDELAKGPTPFMPATVSAPRVPIPTFAQARPPQGMQQGGSILDPNMVGWPAGYGPNGPTGGGGGGGNIGSIADAFNSGQNTYSTPNASGATGAMAALQAMAEAAQSGNTVAAADGFFGMVNEPTLFLAGEAGPEQVNITPGRSKAFLNDAFSTALGRTPWAKTGTPTPVGLSAPGTSPFLQQMGAALAALGQGINPDLYLSEAVMAAPTGIANSPVRRTR